MQQDTNTQGPLAGIRVLELGTMIAGPFSATLLADFGAEVIKVEQPGVGDPMRNMSPFVKDESLWWNVEGRGKRSITVDLHVEDGQELVRDLAVHCDLLVENFKPGTMARWGLGFERLHDLNRRLVMMSVSGYGQTGPYAGKRSYDRIAQAFAGMLNATGFPDRPPVRPGFSIADFGTAVFGAFAAMMALYHRDARGGQGQHIDVAMYEAMFRLTESMAISYDQLGAVRQRRGNLNAGAAPGDHFLTADDRYLVLTISNNALFGRLCEVMGQPDLPRDPRFATHAERAAYLPEINGIVGDWLRTLTAQQAGELLDAAQLPYSLIYNIADIYADPHYASRGAIATVDHPRLGKLRMQGIVPRLLGTPAPALRPAPTLGQDTRDVLTSLLGMTQAQIEQLYAQKII
ncbi:MAG TPA: CaiB/BaiF CoA-transferase family protein [Bordetella sp.]